MACSDGECWRRAVSFSSPPAAAHFFRSGVTAAAGLVCAVAGGRCPCVPTGPVPLSPPPSVFLLMTPAISVVSGVMAMILAGRVRIVWKTVLSGQWPGVGGQACLPVL
jgi:hypothetical protein